MTSLLRPSRLDPRNLAGQVNRTRLRHSYLTFRRAEDSDAWVAFLLGAASLVAFVLSGLTRG